MGKYDSIGGAVHKGDMDRAQLALQRQQLAQRAQAQQFEQQRAMALDQERREDKAYQRKKEADDTQYVRSRDAEETAYRRKTTREATDYARGRDAANDKYRAERDAIADARAERDFLARQQASDFDAFLRSDADARAQERHDIEMAEFERVNAERAEAKRQQESSIASLFEATMKYGDDDGRGNILLAGQYIDAWNKASGMNIGGIEITYTGMDKSGKAVDLPVPVVTLYDRDKNGQIANPRQLSNNQLKMMFAAFPGASKAMGGRLNNSSKYMEALGLGSTRREAGLSRKDQLSEVSKLAERAQERYNAAIAPGSGVSDEEKAAIQEELDYYGRIASELSGVPAYQRGKPQSGGGATRFNDNF